MIKIAKKFADKLTLEEYPPKTVIAGVQVLQLERSFLNDSGELTELARVGEQGELLLIPGLYLKQINYTQLEPGAIKAWHLHQEQTDVWFVPASSRLLLGLVDLRNDSPTKEEIMRLIGGAGHRRLVVIPPGVAHGLANPYPEPAELIYLTDRHFDPKDEHRLPWDYFGPDFWQLQKS